MLSKLRLLILKYMKPVTIWIGKIHLPYTHKKITGRHYYSLRDCLEPGMVFITRTEGELTNAFIPGDWGHCAIYTGSGTVIEAIGKGVSKTDLISFMMSKDEIICLFPKRTSNTQGLEAALVAEMLVGRPYDYNFISGNQAFYCAELIWHAYSTVLGNNRSFDLNIIFGTETITPEGIVSRKEHWDTIWDSRKVKNEKLHSDFAVGGPANYRLRERGK